MATLESVAEQLSFKLDSRMAKCGSDPHAYVRSTGIRKLTLSCGQSIAQCKVPHFTFIASYDLPG